MPKASSINELGNRYGRLLVVRLSSKKGNKGALFWECLCDCGKTSIVVGNSLRCGTTRSCGCNPRGRNQEFTGKKYGRLTAIRRTRTDKNRNAIWLWKCECGTEKEIIAAHVKAGNTKSCGCLLRSTGKDNTHHLGMLGAISVSQYNKTKSEAVKQGKKFTVSAKYLSDLLIMQKFKCAISGVSIMLNDSAHKGKGTASIDRIDSSKGYVKGNIWWVHKTVNWMKNILTVEELQEYCQKIVDNKKVTKKHLKICCTNK